MVGIVGGVEVDVGAKDRMGILEGAECGLDVRNVWGFGEEKTEDGYSGAPGNGLAPAIFGAADGSTAELLFFTLTHIVLFG